MAKGIDYGRGMTNIDRKTGIRFGVLPQSAVLQSWADSSEGVYLEIPDNVCECETCGASGTISDGYDVCECEDCEGTGEVTIEGESFDDEPIGFVYRGGGIFAHCGECSDIFIEKSPFYTLAPFCSPSAPGACYLVDACEDGAPAYCLPSDWFDEDSPCPYPVWRVDNHALVYCPESCKDWDCFKD